jgi:hypothetical protein
MTTKEFVALGKSLLPELPGFAVKRSLMFIPPVKCVLRGINFDGSSFDKRSFSVTAFALPLCVPTKHLYLNFGARVRHKGAGDRWSMGMADLREELATALKLHAIPFLSRVESLYGFVEVARSYSGNPHTLRAIAFSLARLGETGEAIKGLDQLLGKIDPGVMWQREIADSARLLKSQLVSDPATAKELLKNFETETVKNLGLAEFH